MCALLYTRSDVEFHIQFAREARLNDQVKDVGGVLCVFLPAPPSTYPRAGVFIVGLRRLATFFLFSVLRPRWKVGRQSAGVEIKTTVFFFFPSGLISHTKPNWS